MTEKHITVAFRILAGIGMVLIVLAIRSQRLQIGAQDEAISDIRHRLEALENSTGIAMQRPTHILVLSGNMEDSDVPILEDVQPTDAFPDVPLPEELIVHTAREAERIGVDAGILFALMERESGFDTEAWRMDKNGYESVGLMQINGVTFGWLSERGIDPKESPESNITAAAELLQYYKNERGYSLIEALAAYAAGERGMLSGRGVEGAKRLIEMGCKIHADI